MIVGKNMSETIFFDDFEAEGNIIDISEIVNKPTGNKIKQIELKCDIVGKKNQKAISEIIKKSFKLKIPSRSLEIKAKSTNNTWMYQGGQLDENTKIQYSITISEIDSDLPENWNVLVAVGDTAIMNWIRTRALGELLEEKGIATTKEYLDKIDSILDRDEKKIREYISYGKEMN